MYHHVSFTIDSHCSTVKCIAISTSCLTCVHLYTSTVRVSCVSHYSHTITVSMRNSLSCLNSMCELIFCNNNKIEIFCYRLPLPISRYCNTLSRLPSNLGRWPMPCICLVCTTRSRPPYVSGHRWPMPCKCLVCHKLSSPTSAFRQSMQLHCHSRAVNNTSSPPVTTTSSELNTSQKWLEEQSHGIYVRSSMSCALLACVRRTSANGWWQPRSQDLESDVAVQQCVSHSRGGDGMEAASATDVGDVTTLDVKGLNPTRAAIVMCSRSLEISGHNNLDFVNNTSPHPPDTMLPPQTRTHATVCYHCQVCSLSTHSCHILTILEYMDT